MFRKFILAGLTVSVLALAGCDVYFGPNNGPDTYTYCDQTGCYTCDDFGCWPSGSDPNNPGPGSYCDSNYQCAAGCFCNAVGQCEEGGFCNSDAECPSGFECDSRASCVPSGTGGTSCTSDSDCANGAFCDEATGQCQDSWTCQSDADCGVGMDCDSRGTCVPGACTSNDQCAQGCFCSDNGECVESGFCNTNTDCMTGFECDSRGTCVPADDTPPTCEQTGCASGETCNTTTGQCEPIPDCTNTPGMCTPAETCNTTTGQCEDAACLLITDESACASRSDCQPVYGATCTDPQGNVCTEGSANCQCTGLMFQFCQDIANTP